MLFCFCFCSWICKHLHSLDSSMIKTLNLSFSHSQFFASCQKSKIQFHFSQVVIEISKFIKHKKKMNSSIENLPSKVLLKIFSYLPLNDIFSLMTTSEILYNVSPDHSINLNYFTSSLSDGKWNICTHFPSISFCLDLQFEWCVEEHFQSIL